MRDYCLKYLSRELYLTEIGCLRLWTWFRTFKEKILSLLVPFQGRLWGEKKVLETKCKS